MNSYAFVIALVCPALALFSSLLGHRAGISVLWQGILFGGFIVLGAVLSRKKNRSNCQSRTLDGEPCKRMVLVGQKFCFQHAHGWKAKLRAISRNPSAGFYANIYGNILSIAISIGIGIWAGSPRYPIVVTAPVTKALQTQDSLKVSVTRKNPNPSVLTKLPPAPTLTIVSQ